MSEWLEKKKHLLEKAAIAYKFRSLDPNDKQMTYFKRPPKGRFTKSLETLFGVLAFKKVAVDVDWSETGLQFLLPGVAVELCPDGSWKIVARK